VAQPALWPSLIIIFLLEILSVGYSNYGRLTMPPRAFEKVGLHVGKIVPAGSIMGIYDKGYGETNPSKTRSQLASIFVTVVI